MANFTNDLHHEMLPMTSTILGRSHFVIIVADDATASEGKLAPSDFWSTHLVDMPPVVQAHLHSLVCRVRWNILLSKILHKDNRFWPEANGIVVQKRNSFNALLRLCNLFCEFSERSPFNGKGRNRNITDKDENSNAFARILAHKNHAELHLIHFSDDWLHVVDFSQVLFSTSQP